MEIKELLQVMVDTEASDVYLTVASPPMYRIEGVVQPIGDLKFNPADLEALAKSVMSEAQWHAFSVNHEMDLVIVFSIPDLSRFRVNVLRQRGSVALVIRRIKFDIRSIDELGLPTVLKDLAIKKAGLVLVVGATGSGKSTTLAAMIDYRNSYGPGHIISVEDPIEFVHRHKKCIVTQRELGFDTHSFAEALKHGVRQAPDVILIGEIRDRESMEAAITFADTGHLCLGTLHSTNANQSFERILNFFPADRHNQILMHLSLNLRGIVAQRLIPAPDGKRVPAIEVLVDTPRIKDLIKRGEIDTAKEAMEQGAQEGCQSFDQALFKLYKDGKITAEQALMNADSANNLRLKIKLEGVNEEDALEKLLENEGAGRRGFQIRPAPTAFRKI
ncbi:MAG: PilT/PilU family type 4a pilus ATPase [Deltaproteobacteria bacterium]|nr:PilT/PilU family type 4a pilus ATPase [Deltaproteobacteria bacterium]MDZ4341060.1 PilT/PilU family type 4a pilus ATPase [Candidatus Binatia bacterium]